MDTNVQEVSLAGWKSIVDNGEFDREKPFVLALFKKHGEMSRNGVFHKLFQVQQISAEMKRAERTFNRVVSDMIRYDDTLMLVKGQGGSIKRIKDYPNAGKSGSQAIVINPNPVPKDDAPTKFRQEREAHLLTKAKLVEATKEVERLTAITREHFSMPQ